MTREELQLNFIKQIPLIMAVVRINMLEYRDTFPMVSMPWKQVNAFVKSLDAYTETAQKLLGAEAEVTKPAGAADGESVAGTSLDPVIEGQVRVGDYVLTWTKETV